jgi:hypothetical protein
MSRTHWENLNLFKINFTKLRLLTQINAMCKNFILQKPDQCPSSEVNSDKTQSLISQAQNSIHESCNLLAEKLTESQDEQKEF